MNGRAPVGTIARITYAYKHTGMICTVMRWGGVGFDVEVKLEDGEPWLVSSGFLDPLSPLEQLARAAE